MNFCSKNSEISSAIPEKFYFDPIYEEISFPITPYWQIIDTMEFQRLRDIKQLGNAHYIFGGGTHTRFQHCIGTAYLAKKQILKLLKQSNCIFNNTTNLEELNFQNLQRIGIENSSQMRQIIRCVTLAGLCHDIGHGPCSHNWDQFLAKLYPLQAKTQLINYYY
eukprot:TRINITY_DN50507_c0_g1_i1.p1 TRINITY_DN50507_c0_g1~~TRINITY_DN50507_c0_g1_i1.p1  ORF type:complete len:164 (-),score=24.91 TRINITY_DN50507_c0_g1_i1:203-694(-)